MKAKHMKIKINSIYFDTLTKTPLSIFSEGREFWIMKDN